jgi:predicted alpha/beta-hydrolase family hydrolase
MTLAATTITTYPADTGPAALFVFAHGAGAGQKHKFMVATAQELAARGIDVATFDFPYMARGRGAPDRAPVLEQAFRDAVDAARQWSRAGRLVIGGKSMGGRMATHLGAQGLDGLAAIVALGYPLHPPGRPEQLRIAHLPSIEVPLLILQGERDTFGTPSELEPVLKTMHAPVTLHVVAGGDHSLAVRGRTSPEVYDVIHRWITSI